MHVLACIYLHVLAYVCVCVCVCGVLIYMYMNKNVEHATIAIYPPWLAVLSSVYGSLDVHCDITC